jgi:hypothetical protein
MITLTKKIAAVHAVLTVAWCYCMVFDFGQTINRVLGDDLCTMMSIALGVPLTWLVAPWVFGFRFDYTTQLIAQLVLGVTVILNSLCVGALISRLLRYNPSARASVSQ